MVYRKKKKFFKKKKMNYKRKRRIFRPIKNGFPQVMFTKLKWTANVNVTGATATNKAYYLNSLYDPGGSIWGTQPMLFDQLAAIYSSYKVYACKVMIRINNEGTVPVKFAIYADTLGNNPSSFLEAT